MHASRGAGLRSLLLLQAAGLAGVAAAAGISQRVQGTVSGPRYARGGSVHASVPRSLRQLYMTGRGIRPAAVVERNPESSSDFIAAQASSPKVVAMDDQKANWLPTVKLSNPVLLVTSDGAIIAERAVARDLGPMYLKMVREVRYLEGRGLVVDFKNDQFRSDCISKWSSPDALPGMYERGELFKLEGGGGLMPAPVAKALNASRCHERTREFLPRDETEEPGASADSFFTYNFPLILESESYVDDSVEQVKMSMGREFDTLVQKCQWLQGRGLMLDFKINAARRRWETFWQQRPVGFEQRAWAIKRFYKYPLLIESKKISGDTAVITPMKLKENVREIMGDAWKSSVTRNTHFFHDRETMEAKGLILDFKREGTREMWRKKLLERRGKVGLPFSVRNFLWYTDDSPSKIAKRQEQLLKPGAVESLSTPRIFVGNLNKTTSAVDLVIYFSKFGSVKDATVMANTKTGKSRGFGFVTFKDTKASDVVMSQYHTLMGNDLAVQKALGEEDLAIRGSVPTAQFRSADDTPTKNIKVSPLPSGLDESSLRSYFKAFGQITGVMINVESEAADTLRTGDQSDSTVLGATVSFASAEAVENVMQQVKHKIPVKGAEVERTVSVAKEFPQPHFSSEKVQVSQDRTMPEESSPKNVELNSLESKEENVAATFLDDLSNLVEPAVPGEKVSPAPENTESSGPMPGDYNIDPFGVKKDQKLLRRMRLAEIKHSRLAMLAAAAWPIQELFDPAIANLLKVAPLVTEGGRNPSLVNGGLQQVPPLFWGAMLGATLVLELLYGERGLKGEIRIENADMLARGEAGRAVYTEVSPGDLGFDPLGLYPGDRAGQLRAKTGEINNGRLAMMALLIFVTAEYITGESIVDLTPQFFTPFGQ